MSHLTKPHDQVKSKQFSNTKWRVETQSLFHFLVWNPNRHYSSYSISKTKRINRSHEATAAAIPTYQVINKPQHFDYKAKRQRQPPPTKPIKQVSWHGFSFHQINWSFVVCCLPLSLYPEAWNPNCSKKNGQYHRSHFVSMLRIRLPLLQQTTAL